MPQQTKNSLFGKSGKHGLFVHAHFERGEEAFATALASLLVQKILTITL
jgi:hypothetical protein